MIQKHQSMNDGVRDLINAHNLDSVCNTAKTLLEQQIFGSTLRAKIRFPEVFEVSPAQSAERSASEEEAARTEADAIKKIRCGKRDVMPTAQNIDSNVNADLHFRYNHSIDQRPKSRTATSASLHPVYLPFRTQHTLLVTVQKDLEISCYEFAEQNLLELLRTEKWSCAECVELNHWAKILNKRADMFLQQEISELNKSLSELLDSMSQLRHTAVHRLQISANRLLSFLEDSESMAQLLRDQNCGAKISHLRHETSISVEEIKRNEDLLESEYQSKMKKFAAQRAELEKLEQSALEDMFRDDDDYRHIIGINLMEAVDSPETVEASTTATERDADSDAERQRPDQMVLPRRESQS